MFTSLATRILALFLPALDAGACVPEHGDFCFCRKHKKHLVDCWGACGRTNEPC